jgi:hypothetical protein
MGMLSCKEHIPSMRVLLNYVLKFLMPQTKIFGGGEWSFTSVLLYWFHHNRKNSMQNVEKSDFITILVITGKTLIELK